MGKAERAFRNDDAYRGATADKANLGSVDPFRRICASCGKLRLLKYFRLVPEGRDTKCETCYSREAEAQRKEHSAWRKAHIASPEYLENMRLWDRVRRRLAASNRRAAQIMATPWWVDSKELRPVYAEALERTLQTGIAHDVDHVVPLRGKTVCGLHVAWNLRVITRTENLKKNNRFED